MANGLTARSVVASTLLGTHPPRLPGRLLVAFAEEFGINPGTTRVALTRMVDRGELARLDGGDYSLTGALLERQARQSAGLEPELGDWDGEWETWVVRAGSRSSSDRGALRRACAHLGLGELREGVWMRPANLHPDRLPSVRAVVAEQADELRSRPAGDPAELATRVFDTEGWAATAAELAAAIDDMQRRMEGGDAFSLAEGFELAAAGLRHLVHDPLLPEPLWPEGWPSADLRAAYGRYDRSYRAELSAFFRTGLGRND